MTASESLISSKGGRKEGTAFNARVATECCCWLVAVEGGFQRGVGGQTRYYSDTVGAHESLVGRTLCGLEIEGAELEVVDIWYSTNWDCRPVGHYNTENPQATDKPLPGRPTHSLTVCLLPNQADILLSLLRLNARRSLLWPHSALEHR